MLTVDQARQIPSRGSWRTPTAACLYRLYSVSAQLLYVGVTRRHLSERFNGHSRSQHWWPAVATVTVQWFDEEWQALRSERNVIRAERPIHNIRSASVTERHRESFSEPRRESFRPPFTPSRAPEEQGNKGTRERNEGTRELNPVVVMPVNTREARA